mgnify:FL=1
MIDPSLAKYYEDRESMMMTQGWADLMDDIKQMLEARNTLDGTTKDNVDFRKGEVSIIRVMLSLKEVSEAAYQQLKDEDEATA